MHSITKARRGFTLVELLVVIASIGILVRLLLPSNQGRGFRWASGHFPCTVVNTILPPNAELCLVWGDADWGPVPPSSRHAGGCHVLMADGAVRFVTEPIEAGNAFAEPV